MLEQRDNVLPYVDYRTFRMGPGDAAGAPAPRVAVSSDGLPVPGSDQKRRRKTARHLPEAMTPP